MLILASFFTPDTPSADSSTEAIAAQLDEDRSMHQVSLLLGFLGDIAFLLFLTGLWSRLRRHEGSGGMFSGLFVVAGAVFVSTILISEGLYLALVQGSESAGDDPAVLRTLVVLDNSVGAAVVPAGIAMFLGAAGAILTTRALPAWLGWLAGVTRCCWSSALPRCSTTWRKASSVSPVSPDSCSCSSGCWRRASCCS